MAAAAASSAPPADAATVIALARQYGFTRRDLLMLKTQFQLFDPENTGHITQASLQLLLPAHSIRATPGVIAQLVNELDTNQNGLIEFDEFMRLAYRLKKGGTSNWRQIMDATAPSPNHIDLAELGDVADDDLTDFVPPGPQKKRKKKKKAKVQEAGASASGGQGTGGSGRSAGAAQPSDLERGGSVGAAAPSNMSAVAQLSRSMRNLSDSLGSLAGSVGRIDVVARSNTKRFFGTTPSTEFDPQQRWQSSSFFERRDVDRPPSATPLDQATVNATRTLARSTSSLGARITERTGVAKLARSITKALSRRKEPPPGARDPIPLSAVQARAAAEDAEPDGHEAIFIDDARSESSFVFYPDSDDDDVADRSNSFGAPKPQPLVPKYLLYGTPMPAAHAARVAASPPMSPTALRPNPALSPSAAAAVAAMGAAATAFSNERASAAAAAASSPTRAKRRSEVPLEADAGAGVGDDDTRGTLRGKARRAAAAAAAASVVAAGKGDRRSSSAVELPEVRLPPSSETGSPLARRGSSAADARARRSSIMVPSTPPSQASQLEVPDPRSSPSSDFGDLGPRRGSVADERRSRRSSIQVPSAPSSLATVEPDWSASSVQDAGSATRVPLLRVPPPPSHLAVGSGGGRRQPSYDERVDGGASSAAGGGPRPFSEARPIGGGHSRQSSDQARPSDHDVQEQLRAIDAAERSGGLRPEDARAMRLAIQPVQPSRPPPAYHREDSATTTQPLSGGVQFVDATGGKVIDLDSRGAVSASGALHRTFRRRPQRRAVTASSSSMNRQRSLVYHDAVLQDPRIRKQIAELKQYQPVFIILICMVFTLYMIYPLVLNNGFAPISSNIFYGASRVNVIRAGAKFMPCMRQMSADEFAYFSVTGYDSVVGCPSGYTGSYVNGTVGLCTFYDWLDSVCGMGGFGGNVPNQWWRYFTPLVLQEGIIYLAVMILLYAWIGTRVERELGFLRVSLIWLIAGVLGVAFALIMSPMTETTGASGSFYGFLALLYLDLFQNWPLLIRPWANFFFLTFMFLFAMAIGLLPFIDNFTHIGGFIGGLLAGLIFAPMITFGKWDGRRKRLLILLAIPILVALFVLAIYGFYNGAGIDFCPNCTYLDCVPAGTSWCASFGQ